jgi:hypothetical protein
MKTAKRVRFSTLVPIAGRQLRTLEDGPEWDVAIEDGMVRVTYRRKESGRANVEAVAHTTYVPLHLVECIELEPVDVLKAAPPPPKPHGAKGK